MNEAMKAVSDICDTIMKKVDRAYVLECGKKQAVRSAPPAAPSPTA